MNRDTHYRPQPRSLNGVERQPVPQRPVPLPTVAVEPPPPPPPPRAAYLIDDFSRQARQASARMTHLDQASISDRMEAILSQEDELTAIEATEVVEQPLQLTPAVSTGSFLPISGGMTQEAAAPYSAPLRRMVAVWVRFGIPTLATILIGIGIAMTVVTIINNAVLTEQIQTFGAEAADSGEVQAGVKGESQGGTMPASTVTDPLAPRQIDISSIGISSTMTIVGVNNRGNIGAPANIRQASWYKGSDSPVKAGGDAMIIAHVGTDRYPGAFARLHEVQTGEVVSLTMGDGKKVDYRVAKTDNVLPEQMDVDTYIGKGAAHSETLIHLVTCAGDYNANTRTYTHRLIVTAQRVY